MYNKITEIQIIPIKASDGLIGFVSFVYDNSFYLEGIGIYTRPQGGLRLTYPMRKHLSGCVNVFHPISRQVSESIERAVEQKFNELLSI